MLGQIEENRTLFGLSQDQAATAVHVYRLALQAEGDQHVATMRLRYLNAVLYKTFRQIEAQLRDREHPQPTKGSIASAGTAVGRGYASDAKLFYFQLLYGEAATRASWPTEWNRFARKLYLGKRWGLLEEAFSVGIFSAILSHAVLNTFFKRTLKMD